MIKCFELDSNQVSIRNILNKNFLEIEIHAISNAKPNRNKSYFTPESMQKGIETFSDKPILGFFNKQNDFESHNGKVAYDPELDKDYWDNSNGEQILGFVRQSDPREIREESDGLLWIVCNAMICTQYNYKQVKRLLKDRRKKVSVEVSINNSEIIDGIEYIYDFDLIGITILGSKNGSAVREGIEGAHLSVLDLFEQNMFNRQREALVFAYSQLDEDETKKEDGDLAKDDIGTKGALSVNKSKEAMSDTAWSEVDKTELRNRVVAASNFKEIAGDVFLDLREGWEEGEVSKLKYPVMQIVDENKLVYNRSALASAKAYAEKNGEEEVLKKLKAIYEHLDLEFEAEEKFDCEGFSDLYEDELDDDCDDCKGVCSEENPEENPEEDPEDDLGDEEFTLEQMKEKCAQLEAECGELRMKCENSEKDRAELAQKCADYETMICGFNTKIAECEEHIKDYDDVKKALNDCNEKLAEIEIKDRKAHIEEMQSKLRLTAEELKDVFDKCEKREYSDVECIDRDIAFIVFQKKVADIKENKKEDYSVNIEPVVNIEKSDRKNMTISERLRSHIK